MCCTMTLFDNYYIPYEIIINCIQVTVSVVVWLRVGDWWRLLAAPTSLQVGRTLILHFHMIVMWLTVNVKSRLVQQQRQHADQDLV